MFTEQLVAGGDGAINLASGPPHGPPLLFLHGVGRCWQDFSTLIPALAWRWQVYALDFRGHGSSQRTADRYLVRDYVRDAVAIVQRHIGRPTIVYGHSLGALVAAATAAELAGLVRGVVLEDPPFDILGPNIHQTSFHSLFTAMRAASGAGRSVAEAARVLADARIVVPGKPGSARLGDLRDASALRFGAARLLRVDPRLWDPLLSGHWMDGYDKVSLLGQVRAPALLLHGKETEGGMLGDAGAAEAESLLADCTRVFVPRAGHLIHGLQTELTLRLLNGFLDSIAFDELPRGDERRNAGNDPKI